MRGGIVCILAVLLILASSIGFLAGNTEAEDSGFDSENVWPMLGGDPQHTGGSQYNTSGNLGGTVWIIDEYIVPSVTIDQNGVIYAPCDDNSLKAIYPNGTYKWTFSTGDHVQSCPAIAEDGSIYFGCDDFNLYSLYPNGTERWRFTAGDEIDSSPVIDDEGMIYFCSYDRKLYCLDQNGNEQWNFSTDELGYTNPALNHNGEIVFGSTGGILYCVYPNGTLRWSSEVGGEISGTISIDDEGNIYCIKGENDHLHTFDSDGNWRWSYFLIEGSPNGVSIGKDGTVYCGAGSNLFALDTHGSFIWAFPTGGKVRGSPAISADGTIFFGSEDGNFYAVDQSGNEVWTFEGGGYSWIWGSPAIGSDGTIYIGNHDSLFFAINGVPDVSTSLVVGASFALIAGILLAIWVAYPKKKD
jgi:outer membrane protein assembly factor BamB